MSENLDSSFTLYLSQGNSLGLGPAGYMDNVTYRFHLALPVNPTKTEKCLHPLFIMMMVQISSFKNESWGIKSKSGYTKFLLSDIIWWLACLLWGEGICLHSLDPVHLKYWNIFTVFSRYSTSNLPEWTVEVGIRYLLKSLFPISKSMSENNFFFVMATFFMSYRFGTLASEQLPRRSRICHKM